MPICQARSSPMVAAWRSTGFLQQLHGTRRVCVARVHAACFRSERAVSICNLLMVRKVDRNRSNLHHRTNRASSDGSALASPHVNAKSTRPSRPRDASRPLDGAVVHRRPCDLRLLRSVRRRGDRRLVSGQRSAVVDLWYGNSCTVSVRATQEVLSDGGSHRLRHPVGTRDGSHYPPRVRRTATRICPPALWGPCTTRNSAARWRQRAEMRRGLALLHRSTASKRPTNRCRSNDSVAVCIDHARSQAPQRSDSTRARKGTTVGAPTSSQPIRCWRAAQSASPHSNCALMINVAGYSRRVNQTATLHAGCRLDRDGFACALRG